MICLRFCYFCQKTLFFILGVAHNDSFLIHIVPLFTSYYSNLEMEAECLTKNLSYIASFEFKYLQNKK